MEDKVRECLDNVNYEKMMEHLTLFGSVEYKVNYETKEIKVVDREII